MNLLNFIGQYIHVQGQHDRAIYHCNGILKLENNYLVIRENDSYFCINIQFVDDYVLNECYFNETKNVYFYKTQD